MVSKVVRFFDPHPGLMGCMIPIPNEVKDVADSLNACVMDLADAMGQLERTFPSGVFQAHIDKGFIGLTVGDLSKGDVVHSWRVIRFRETE